MKSAEKWRTECWSTLKDVAPHTIQAIQLDAKKAGMIKAAEIAEKKRANFIKEVEHIPLIIHDAILTACDEMKSL
jgi:hypothetical protein